MRTRTLAILLALLCLLAGLLSGCGGNDDKLATGSSSSSTTDGGSSGNAPGGSGASKTPGSTPSPGAAATDPMNNDKGAPGTPDTQGRQTVVFERLPGNTSGACIVVGGRRDVRSGGFVGGSFDDARKSYGKVRPGLNRKQVRLHWVPQHTKPMGGVPVVATSGNKSVRVIQRSVADAEQWKFYDTLVKLPSRGTWRFKVSSGPDHGCFVVSF